MNEEMKPDVKITSDVEQKTESLGDAAKNLAQKVADKVEDIAEAAADKLDTAKQVVAEKAAEVKEAVQEKVEDAKEAVSDAAEAAADKLDTAKQVAAEKAADVKEAVQEKVEDVKEKIAEKKEDASEKAADVKEAVSEKAEEVKEKVEEAKEEVKEKAEEVKEAVQEKVEDVKEEIAEKKEDASEKAEEVEEAVEEKVEASEEKPVEETVDYSGMTLAELVAAFEALMKDEDRMRKNKSVEAIKSSFYRTLSKEREAAGVEGAANEPSGDSVEVEEASEADDSFTAIEKSFKAMYSQYKKERAEYNKEMDLQRADNLVKKQAVIDELKTLVETPDKVGFPEFRALQARWREIGPVPQKDMNDINQTYHFYVEQFYDKASMDRAMRDLDFKKNLEAKEKFCEEAERLSESEDVVGAFKELQKLHEQWKEFGPVAKEFRESIWERFRAATSVINKKYQAFFEGQKEKLAENLQKKQALCERVEAIAARTDIGSSREWNSLSDEIEGIQKEWKGIGFTSRKDNQKIYERFRAACDAFYLRKREFYTGFKANMNENYDKKMELIEQAEALKDSTDWKSTSDKLIELQKQWKEIGAVPRKKSEQLWKRFRSACDAFFNERDKNNPKGENDYGANLKAKKAIIEEINAYDGSDSEAASDFLQRFQAIGFVPYKEKESIQQAFRDAMAAKFPDFSLRGSSRTRGQRPSEGRGQRPGRPLTEKDKLVAKYNALQGEIDTYENNIGFFAASKNAEALIAQTMKKVEEAKKELKELEEKIRKIEEAE